MGGIELIIYILSIIATAIDWGLTIVGALALLYVYGMILYVLVCNALAWLGDLLVMGLVWGWELGAMAVEWAIVGIDLFMMPLAWGWELGAMAVEWVIVGIDLLIIALAWAVGSAIVGIDLFVIALAWGWELSTMAVERVIVGIDLFVIALAWGWELGDLLSFLGLLSWIAAIAIALNVLLYLIAICLIPATALIYMCLSQKYIRSKWALFMLFQICITAFNLSPNWFWKPVRWQMFEGWRQANG